MTAMAASDKVLQPSIARPIEDRPMNLYCANVAIAKQAARKETSDICSWESLVDIVRTVRMPTLIVTGKPPPLMPAGRHS
jgi:hypothetical protein